MDLETNFREETWAGNQSQKGNVRRQKEMEDTLVVLVYADRGKTRPMLISTPFHLSYSQSPYLCSGRNPAWAHMDNSCMNCKVVKPYSSHL